MSENCRCPGPANTIAKDGMCPSCGVEGPDHQRALNEHLAAGNPQPLIDKARDEGRREGYRSGMALGERVGRANAEADLTLWLPRPKARDLEPEMEL